MQKAVGAAFPESDQSHLSGAWIMRARVDHEAAQRWARCFAVAGALGLAMANGPALADCGMLAGQVDRARAMGDLQTLRALHGQVVVDATCDATYRSWLGQVVARDMAQGILGQLRAGTPLPSLESEIKQAASYGEFWMVEAWLGDIHFDRKDYTASAGHYQLALAGIQDESATPQAPPERVIAHLFKRAEQSRMLADEYVATPRTRAGSPTGLGAKNVRGFVPQSVALPVEFEFDSSEFTEKGMAAANDLLRQLTGGDATRITLIGHTDPAGSAAYNQRLSEERASALAAFLEQGGYRGEILIEGRGEAEPPDVPNPDQFTPEQLDQLARRVELRR